MIAPRTVIGMLKAIAIQQNTACPIMDKLIVFDTVIARRIHGNSLTIRLKGTETITDKH